MTAIRIAPTQHRLDELERVITWEGELTNQRIRELLGVTSVHASRLLGDLKRRLGERASRASAYAPLRMLHKARKGHARRSPDEYMFLLQSLAGVSKGLAVEVVSDARLDLSVVAPETFATVYQAISKGLAIWMRYRSMNSPEGTERIVFPHALVRAPRRWHMRAWCVEKQEFRDFNLGRIADTKLRDEAATRGRSEDVGWNTQVQLHVVPHPALTPAQSKMIADEYFPGAAAMRLAARACVAPYIVQDLRLATSPERDLPPEFQLLLLNPEEVGASFAKEAAFPWPSRKPKSSASAFHRT
jgi:hypothetical protein